MLSSHNTLSKVKGIKQALYAELPFHVTASW